MAFADAISSSANRAAAAGTIRKLGLALTVVAATWLPTHAAWAYEQATPADAAVSLAALPPQAHQTTQLIRRGGPFPFAKDGVVFGNRERLLPRQDRGYYREYTVKTPGVRDRGARRIVCGGLEATAPEVCYYTADHYASFKRIAQ